MNTRCLYFLVCVLSLLPTGCSDYTWTLNETVLYEPAELFSDFDLPDKALLQCVQQTIADRRLHRADELESLSCTDAGVFSVAGVEQFSHLKSLDLDNNNISDAAPLSLLPRLEILHLRNNQFETVEALICASKLREIALEGNDKLNCQDLRYLRDCGIRVIDFPRAC